jgi:hypothetical protein
MYTNAIFAELMYTNAIFAKLMYTNVLFCRPYMGLIDSLAKWLILPPKSTSEEL